MGFGSENPIHILHRGFDSKPLCRNRPKNTYLTSLSFGKTLFIRDVIESTALPTFQSVTRRLQLMEFAVTMETLTSGAKVKPSVTDTAVLDRVFTQTMV